MLKWIRTKERLKKGEFEESTVNSYPYYIPGERGTCAKLFLKVRKRTMAITSYQYGGISNAIMKIIYSLTRAGGIGL